MIDCRYRHYLLICHWDYIFVHIVFIVKKNGKKEVQKAKENLYVTVVEHMNNILQESKEMAISCEWGEEAKDQYIGKLIEK